MKSLLIINPVAGQGKPHHAAADVEAAFRDTVRHVIVTSGAGDAEAAALMAGETGDFDEVLVAGGDGTVNEVVNGLTKGLGRTGASVSDGHDGDRRVIPLGIIPLGTQNVLADELGIPAGNLDA